jgi:hypothetical protein
VRSQEGHAEQIDCPNQGASAGARCRGHPHTGQNRELGKILGTSVHCRAAKVLLDPAYGMPEYEVECPEEGPAPKRTPDAQFVALMDLLEGHREGVRNWRAFFAKNWAGASGIPNNF